MEFFMYYSLFLHSVEHNCKDTRLSIYPVYDTENSMQPLQIHHKSVTKLMLDCSIIHFSGFIQKKIENKHDFIFYVRTQDNDQFCSKAFLMHISNFLLSANDLKNSQQPLANSYSSWPHPGPHLRKNVRTQDVRTQDFFKDEGSLNNFGIIIITHKKYNETMKIEQKNI